MSYSRQNTVVSSRLQLSVSICVVVPLSRYLRYINTSLHYMRCVSPPNAAAIRYLTAAMESLTSMFNGFCLFLLIGKVYETKPDDVMCVCVRLL